MINRILLIAFVFFIGATKTIAQNSGKGEIKGPVVWKSKIYPGTERNYWIYVPKQYDPSKPACTMIVQDGLSRAAGWKLPDVLDSLIALKQIPVIIGIFIDHGQVPASGSDHWPRYNRSLEYDGLGDRYARFLLEEILPEVRRSYNISVNPNDRSIAGASSGAICAFNAAWERPDQFRRVLSTIGTYVGLRGGEEFATLVRKTEPKPLRIFLEDGNHDLNIYAGDWWSANQNMLSALTWSGYEVNHAWGEGGHDSKHALTIMADALVWLWKDYPVPVMIHPGASPRINPAIIEEPWKEVVMKSGASRLAIDKAGQVFFTDKQSIFRITEAGDITLFTNLNGEAGGISWAADDKLYAADLTHDKVVILDAKGATINSLSGLHANYLTASRNGLYFSDGNKNRIGFYSFAMKKSYFTDVPERPTGLALSAEQTLLNVGVEKGVFGQSFKINDDGTLDLGQDYIHYHIPYGATTPSITGMTVDAENLLYAATAMGIQVSDQLGRVNFIFSKPAEGTGDVKIGGEQLNTIYAAIGGKLYRRRIGAKGVLSYLPAVKPSKPGM